jgi:hypothetical protein
MIPKKSNYIVANGLLKGSKPQAKVWRIGPFQLVTPMQPYGRLHFLWMNSVTLPPRPQPEIIKNRYLVL